MPGSLPDSLGQRRLVVSTCPYLLSLFSMTIAVPLS